MNLAKELVPVMVVLIGSIVIWSTPIRKDKATFRKINLIFAVSLSFETVYLVSADPLFSKQFLVLKIVLIGIFAALSSKRKQVPSSNESSNRTTVSRQNLRIWWFLIGLAFIAGSVAYLLDMNNQSDSDRYFGTNDSATIISGVTFIVLGILGTGARFSYLKYSRVNQADLIADAIKFHVQSPSSSRVKESPQLSRENPTDVESRLRKLAALHADSLISKDEYETKKKQIIDSL